MLQLTTLVGRTGCRDLSFNQNEAVSLFRKEEGGLLDSIWTIQIEEGGARGGDDGVHLVRVCWTMAMGECCSRLSVVTME